MIKFECIDRIVNFTDNNTTEIRVVLKVSDKKILKAGKKIDKEYFSPKCYGIGFIYDHNENKMYLLGKSLYYVDNGGDDNYIKIDKDIIIKLQSETEQEYKKYMENSKEYLKNNKFLFVEEI